jgi:hypothetical protein
VHAADQLHNGRGGGICSALAVVIAARKAVGRHAEKLAAAEAMKQDVVNCASGDSARFHRLFARAAVVWVREVLQGKEYPEMVAWFLGAR